MSKVDNNESGKLKISLILSLLVIIDLLFLYYLKYRNQRLSISYFDLFNTGNFLNLAFAVIIIAGLLIGYNNPRIISKKVILVSLAVVMTFSLIMASIELIYNPLILPGYIFNRPETEVLVGALFSLYQFFQIIMLTIIWGSLLQKKELLILKSVIISLVVVLLLLVFAYLSLLSGMKGKYKYFSKKNPADVVVVLGAAVWSENKPSPSLASRVDKAADLYRRGIVKKILLTGSNAPGELSEAEVAYEYVRRKGINPRNVWIENKTTSTTEQIHFIKFDLMGKDAAADVIIISDAYHLARVNEICKFFDIDAALSSSELELSFKPKAQSILRESVAMVIFWFFAL
jgi:vancomycin permeability regulator SanA